MADGQSQIKAIPSFDTGSHAAACDCWMRALRSGHRKNNTDKVLTIYEDATTLHQMPGRPKNLAGTVQPGEELRPKPIPDSFNTYLIEAKDAQGNIVYSKVFTRQELEDMNWEVTITESQ